MSLTKAKNRMIDGASANVMDFGAVGDGVTNDTSAVQAAINSGNKVIYFPEGDYVIGSLTASSKVSFVGQGVIHNFSGITTTADIIIDGLSFEDCSNIIILNAAYDYDLIKFTNCSVTGSTDFIVGEQADVLEKFVFTNNYITDCDLGTNVNLIRLGSYIKSAFIQDNTIKDISSTSNGCTVFSLGKTSAADAFDTGNYICSNNVISGITANGTGAGEVHAFLLYGHNVTVSGNVIENIDRPSDRQSGGVEGIYTKSPIVVIDGNILTDAGFAEGNKGAQINCKGASYNVVITNNVIEDSDHNLTGGLGRSGIRVELTNTNDIENCVISGNLVRASRYGIQFSGGSLSTTDTLGKNVSITNNTVLMKSLFNSATDTIFSGIYVKQFLNTTSSNNYILLEGYCLNESKGLIFEISTTDSQDTTLFVNSNHVAAKNISGGGTVGVNIFPTTNNLVKSAVLQNNVFDAVDYVYQLSGGDASYKGLALLETTVFDLGTAKERAGSPPTTNVTERNYLAITNA